MNSNEFKKVFSRLKELGRMQDAAWQDITGNEGVDDGTWRTCRADLQEGLEKLISENELTETQVRVLKTIVYQTPTGRRASNEEACAVSVLAPYSGIFENMPETFENNLRGMARFQVQGPICKGYMPVKIERRRVTDTNDR